MKFKLLIVTTASIDRISGSMRGSPQTGRGFEMNPEHVSTEEMLKVQTLVGKIICISCILFLIPTCTFIALFIGVIYGAIIGGWELASTTARWCWEDLVKQWNAKSH